MPAKGTYLVNAHTIEEGVAHIKLSHGQEALVDEADLPRVLEYHWGARQRDPDKHWVACSGGGYMGPALVLHRFILEAADDVKVKARNKNHLDCRRANLYVVKYLTVEERHSLAGHLHRQTKQEWRSLRNPTGIRNLYLYKRQNGEPEGYFFNCRGRTCQAQHYFGLAQWQEAVAYVRQHYLTEHA